MLLFATSIHRARAAVFASAMVATALLAAGCTPGAAPTAQVPSAATSHPPSAETAKRADDLRALARDVYVWGYPIVDNYRIMHAYVIDRQHPEYKGPFNAVHSNARLITPQDRAVLSPNSDTPYSLAWLDLRAEPMVLSVPRVERGRYYSIQTPGPAKPATPGCSCGATSTTTGAASTTRASSPPTASPSTTTCRPN